MEEPRKAMKTLLQIHPLHLPLKEEPRLGLAELYVIV